MHRDQYVSINDREFQNAVVKKFWIEKDMLRQYRVLEPKIEKVLETLNSEIEIHRLVQNNRPA